MNIQELLLYGMEQKASDLHLASGMPPLLRIDGDLVPVKDAAKLTATQCKELIYSTMTPLQQSIFEKELELDYAFTIENKARFRINAFNQIHGMSAAFRTIPETIPTLEELELPEVFKDLLDLPNGLILVTGPTGSGKSTTLAAMINYLNTTQALHIITIEDPIEFTHSCKKSLINQRQVHEHTHDFNIALRSSLREDPDVILVGELRDLETIRLALTAAETGHLVLATLHTSSAPRAVNRIIDVFPSGEKNIIRNLLSESLQAVICQSLIKKIPSGRVPAFEIMIGNSAIRNLIREDKIAQIYSVMQTGSSSGMVTLDQYLEKLVGIKQISKETAHSLALNKGAFI